MPCRSVRGVAERSGGLIERQGAARGGRDGDEGRGVAVGVGCGERSCDDTGCGIGRCDRGCAGDRIGIEGADFNGDDRGGSAAVPVGDRDGESVGALGCGGVVGRRGVAGVGVGGVDEGAVSGDDCSALGRADSGRVGGCVAVGVGDGQCPGDGPGGDVRVADGRGGGDGIGVGRRDGDGDRNHGSAAVAVGNFKCEGVDECIGCGALRRGRVPRDRVGRVGEGTGCGIELDSAAQWRGLCGERDGVSVSVTGRDRPRHHTGGRTGCTH